MRTALFIVLGVLIGISATAGGSARLRATTTTPLDIVVVCVKCIPEDMPQEAYNSGNILLDQHTGQLWFYPALSPGVTPRLLGTLGTLGQPIAKPPAR